MKKKFELPKLPYALNALEPVISEEIMNLHYNKHHAAYVKNLNDALDKMDAIENEGNLDGQIKLQSAIRFNGGGHINHSIFWTNLAPKDQGGGEPPQGEIANEIKKKFGSLDQFVQEFNAETAAVQGSGWGWLAVHPKKKCIKIVTCPNQDPLSMTGLVPLLGIDVWEHAYYLQYKNVRPDYLKAIWQVVNWKNVEERYLKAIG